MIIRAKTKTLFEGKPLTDAQQENTQCNIRQMEEGRTVLSALPRRLVFELTNACNLNCIMCGRNAVDFKPTVFNMDWFRWFEPLYDTVEEVTLMGWGEPTIHPHFQEMLQILDRHAVRKYFCTNGMYLNKIMDALFDYHVDVFAVSVDGATAQTNDRIRLGSSLEQISASLRTIVARKREKNLSYPYINFVFCAMRSNLHELPALVELAADIGLEEVKVVFLTAFSDEMAGETLLGCEDEVQAVFEEATRKGDALGVLLKLPYVKGTDPAGEKLHRDCFVGWRDFFLGSDGFVRPCMSTAEKLFAFDLSQPFTDMWNAPALQQHRARVNDPEKMNIYCRHCYQSSHCNWNLDKSYVQTGETFAPEWGGEP